MALACLGIFYRQFASGYSAAFSLFGELGFVKGVIADSYLMLIVFFYGIASRGMALALTKFIVLVASVMALVTVIDVLGLLNIGLISYRDDRLEGPLGQANEYAVFLSFFIPFLMLAAINGKGVIVRGLYLLGALISFALLIQTGSRGGFVSLTGGTVLGALWLYGGYDTHRAFLWGATVVLAVVGITGGMLAVNEGVRDLVMTRVELSFSGGADQASAGRTWIWMQGLEYQLARPWSLAMGFGLGSFTDRIGINPHNAYLNYLFSLGLLGLGLFVTVVLRILLIVRQAFFSPVATVEERTVLAALVLGWCALSIAMVTATIYKAWLFVWPMTGLCLYLAYCIRAKETEGEGADLASKAALKRQKAHTFMEDGYIFQHPITKRPYASDKVPREQFDQVLRAVGIRRRVAYQTRHTFATLALMSGANVLWVSRQLGYSTMHTTLRVYTKWIDGADEGSETGKVDQYVSGAPDGFDKTGAS